MANEQSANETVWPLPWPFSFVVDARGRDVGWAVIHSEVVSPRRQEIFAQLRRSGYRFIGMSSDTTFPLFARGAALDYAAVCEGWCHCFREPDRYLPSGIRRVLLSASDFTDPLIVSPARALGTMAPSFDVVYVGTSEAWKREAKGVDWALHWLPRLACGLRCSVLAVGLSEQDAARCEGVATLPILPWPEFLAHLARAAVLLMPGQPDASPRVMAEALCLNVRLAVNGEILGGWKYVNAFTGAFFDADRDALSAVGVALRANGNPRRWFTAHYGTYHAGRRLLEFMLSLDPAIQERSHLGIAQASIAKRVPA